MSLSSRVLDRDQASVTVENNTVVLRGVIREESATTWLMPLINELHEEAVKLRLPQVTLDLSHLEYSNAMVWRCFVSWIRRVHDDQNAQYCLRILSSSRYRWQRVGIPTLRVFGGKRLIIVEKPN
jgi:hypothetical protein